MAGFELHEWIDAPLETVFAAMTDPERAPEIMPNIVKVEKLTAGPPGTGTRLRETRLVNGKESQAELLVEAYEPPHTYAVSTEQDDIKVTYRYSLRPEKNGTALHLQANVDSAGLKKLMAPLVARIMKREDGDHLEHLKRAVEGRS